MNFFSLFKSTKPPKHWLIISLLLGLLSGLIIVLLSKFLTQNIKENTYFYFFSSIIQGFLGLVAFLGAVVVFQLQEIHDRREKTKKANLDKPTEIEIRRSLTWFAILSFINVIFAMFFVIITGQLYIHQKWGITALALSIALSIAVLVYAVWIIRRTIFWHS